MVEDRSTDENIRLEVELSVPPDVAWQLLTEKGHLAFWWGDHVTLEAKHLGAFVEKWSDGGRQIVTSGQITRFEPPFRLDLTWSDHDWPGETEVSMRLSRLGDGARFELDHYGWDVHPAARRRELMAAHAAGWRAHLTRLADYAAKHKA